MGEGFTNTGVMVILIYFYVLFSNSFRHFDFLNLQLDHKPLRGGTASN